MCKLAATMKSCLCVVYVILFSTVIFASGGQLTFVKVESNINENGTAAEESTKKIPAIVTQDSLRTPVGTEVENGALMPLAESINKTPASANVTRTDYKTEHNVTPKSHINITQNESANEDATKDHVKRRILMEGSMAEPLDSILKGAAKEEKHILRPVWMDEPLGKTAKDAVELENSTNEKKAEFAKAAFGENLNHTVKIEAPSTEATKSHNKIEDTTRKPLQVLQTPVNETRIHATNQGNLMRDTTKKSDNIWPTLVNLSNHVMTTSLDIANRISKNAADLSLTQPVDLSFKSQASRVESKNAHKSFKHILSLSLKSGHDAHLNTDHVNIETTTNLPVINKENIRDWNTTKHPIKYKPRRHPKGRRYRHPNTYRRRC